MLEPLEDRNLLEVRPLITPDAVKRGLPLHEPAAGVVRGARAALRDLLHGRDRRRLAVIVGPCSLHDRFAALEFAERLARVAEDTRDALVVLMRAYFEKPRTTVGWKGLINDPHLDDTCDIPAGLALAREILLEIHAMGLPCASEFLDPVTPQYIGDLISWAAIGARTTESQPHRQMASGLSMPVGFKNGTDGGLQVALDALEAAAAPHSFLGVTGEGATAVIKTRGNVDGHVVLRGGGGRTNYGAADVAAAAAQVGVARGVVVDCSPRQLRQEPRTPARRLPRGAAPVRLGPARTPRPDARESPRARPPGLAAAPPHLRPIHDRRLLGLGGHEVSALRGRGYGPAPGRVRGAVSGRQEPSRRGIFRPVSDPGAFVSRARAGGPGSCPCLRCACGCVRPHRLEA